MSRSKCGTAAGAAYACATAKRKVRMIRDFIWRSSRETCANVAEGASKEVTRRAASDLHLSTADGTVRPMTPIRPLILGSGSSGKAIAKSLAVLRVVHPELAT